jgi:hypothetical protein
MKKIFFGVIICCSLLIACQTAEEESNSATQNTTINTPATIPGTDTTNAVAGPASTTPPPAAPVVANPVTAPPPPSAPIAGASPKVNPAHGLPGHRCDIQVGAPLPAAGSPVTTPAVQAGPTVESVTPPPPPSTIVSPVAGKGKAINPAHGQPGHRCDIAVGAPLN